MISHIRIKDFAIIEELDVDFNKGLNIITGETGAGKSIIIEAVSLALGSRADTSYVRTGKDKAVIQLIATLGDEEYVITREVSASGKSISKVNDEIVSLGYLSGLCRKIADIHGQYDHQSLLNPETHIDLLDLYNPNILNVKTEVSALYHDYSTIKGKLNDLSKNTAERQRKIDFMKFELSEIIEANLRPNEDENLSKQINLLQNGEKIFSNLSTSYDLIYSQSPSSLESLGKSLKLLEDVADFSPQLTEMKETLSDCYYKIEDLSSDLRKVRDSITFSPDELDQAIGRLDLIESLKRKYGNSLSAVLDYKIFLEEELSKTENADELKSELSLKLIDAENKLSNACNSLSLLRKSTAVDLEVNINHELEELNFSNTQFSVSFKASEHGGAVFYTANGIDLIEFMIITNKGEVPKPLAKIASGGEISRIMLAFKRIIGRFDLIPTMIFDEIDSGISGVTAAIVGKKLKVISENHQIICITHLPQIAAYGDSHYQIQKFSDEISTRTTVIPLNEEEKVIEIARLLGGLNITESALQNARELLNTST